MIVAGAAWRARSRAGLRAQRRRWRLRAVVKVAAAPQLGCEASPALPFGLLLRLEPPCQAIPLALARPRHLRELGDALVGAVARWSSSRWRALAPQLAPAALALTATGAILWAVAALASHCHLP